MYYIYEAIWKSYHIYTINLKVLVNLVIGIWKIKFEEYAILWGFTYSSQYFIN